MKDKKTSTYRGVIVPMVTPFTDSGKIDRPSARRLIQFLIGNGTIPFILGTSGEVYSIAIEERNVLIRTLLELRKDGIPLIVGMGGLTFDDTVRLSNQYFEWGIDAVVLTLPGYFALRDDQIFQYFNEISAKIKGDIILYNIPATIHNSLSIEVIDKLSRSENIIGIKDSEFDENKMLESLKLWKNRDDFFFLVGVHELMLQGLILGADGLVPSTANLCPDLYNKMFTLHLEGKNDEVEKIHVRTSEILSLYKNGRLLGESLSILKYLVSLSGLISPNMLPPLTGLTEEEKKDVYLKWKRLITN